MMEIEETSGRLMRRRIRLGELNLHIDYKKSTKNKQTDALYRLETLRNTVIQLDEEITCLLMSEYNEEEDIAPKALDWH